jgi:hypothetical protein
MKSLRDWIDEERGRSAALASHLGVSPARMSQIVDAGVPVKFMLQVNRFTRGAVTLESMIAIRTPGQPTPHPQTSSTADLATTQPATPAPAGSDIATAAAGQGA